MQQARIDVTVTFVEFVVKTGAWSEGDFHLLMTGFTRSIGLTEPEAKAVTEKLQRRAANRLWIGMKAAMDRQKEAAQ
jgi:hypothetical protein